MPGTKRGRGAPRTVSLPKDEMIKLGMEMVAWVKSNKPLHLSLWYKGQKQFSYNQWQSFIKCDEFIPYYDQSISLISENYLNGTVPPPIASRFLRLYFTDMRDEENEKMKYEASLKKQEETKQPTEIIFKVNYDNDARNKVQISSEEISA